MTAELPQPRHFYTEEEVRAAFAKDPRPINYGAFPIIIEDVDYPGGEEGAKALRERFPDGGSVIEAMAGYIEENPGAAAEFAPEGEICGCCGERPLIITLPVKTSLAGSGDYVIRNVFYCPGCTAGITLTATS